ncbi:hypothetical protein [Helicobacter labetoulli]|uniref:hypothetical protein n=1 Tax=Helicobacter labetoulli TaxID=2315333 RepID=UPI000EF6A85D|nr:hypothetical protein [Helicobacter labetoulli]
MFASFKKLKFGTKMNLVIALVVLVCIGIIALIILVQSRSTLDKEAKTMLYNVAKRHANNIAPIFDESFALLENTQGVINNFLKAGITLDNKTIDVKRQLAEFPLLKYGVIMDHFGACLSLRRKLQSMYHYEKSQ